MDKPPRYRDLVKHGKLNQIECPGVQYLCYFPIYGAQAEYYIVDKNSPAISDEAKSYGKMQEESYAEAERLRAISIYDLDLDVRARNILTRAGYETAYDVVETGPKRLRAARNAGRKTFEAIVEELDKVGVDTTGWRAWLDKKPR